MDTFCRNREGSALFRSISNAGVISSGRPRIAAIAETVKRRREAIGSTLASSLGSGNAGGIVTSALNAGIDRRE